MMLQIFKIYILRLRVEVFPVIRLLGKQLHFTLVFSMTMNLNLVAALHVLRARIFFLVALSLNSNYLTFMQMEKIVQKATPLL